MAAQANATDIQEPEVHRGYGGDEPLCGVWSRVGDNANVPDDNTGTETKAKAKTQPWKAEWPPKAFRQGTIEQDGDIFMRCNQGASIGRPTAK